MFCFCGCFLADVWCWETLSVKRPKSHPFPSFYVIFHVICFFIKENVAKNNWLQNFENFSEKIIWWNSFSKITSLHCSDCNFAIKRTHHRLFLEYVSKTSCFKKIFWGKKIWWTSVLIKLQPCSTQSSIFSKKNGAHVRRSSGSAESSNIFTSKNPWQRPFST